MRTPRLPFASCLALAVTTAVAALGVAAPAHAAPKVLICAADVSSAAAVKTKLAATGAFATVDLLDCSTSATPSLATLKTYDSVLTWSNNTYFDKIGLGNNLADYVDQGGGVVTAMYEIYTGFQLLGRWNTGGYDCILPGGNSSSNAALKPQPNDKTSPLVQGVTALSTNARSVGGLNVAKGAVSVWDYTDGIPAVCKLSISGHLSLSLNFFPSTVTADGITLLKNALLYAAGGGGPFQAMPTSLTFADTGTGSSSQPLSITFTNTSMAQATATGLKIAGANPGDFTVTGPSFPATLGVGASFTAQVTFSPTAMGARAATLQLAVQGQMSTIDVALAGNGIGPKLVVSPSPLELGSPKINGTVSKDLTVTNLGGKVQIKSATLKAVGNDFMLAAGPMYPVTLPANASFTLTVLFSPSMSSVQMADVIFATDDPNNPNVVAKVIGRAGPPSIDLSSGTLIFPPTNVGATSMPQSVTLTNSGNSDLNVTDLAIGGANGGDYKLDKGKLPGLVLAPNATATFAVSFAPTATGTRTATVTVSSANGGSKTLALSGNGTAATVSVTPSSLAFGDVKAGKPSAPQNVTLTNGGSGTLQVTSYLVDGPGAGSYVLSGAMPPLSLPPMGMATVGVSCNPKGVGALAANLQILTDVGQKTVALTCNGIAPMIALTPVKVDFGALSVGVSSAPQTITLANNGKSDLTISKAGFGGANASDFSSADLPGPQTIAAGQKITFHVVFTPSAQQPESAEVDVTSDDPAVPVAKVALSGVGVQLGLSVTPLSQMVDFGMVPVGRTGGPQMIAITNTGNAQLTIGNPVLGGPDAGSFTVANPGPFTIAAGDTANVSVSFTPMMASLAQATLTLAPMGLGQVTIGLRGTGVSPQVSAVPSLLDFGPIRIGNRSQPQTVTVKNAGPGSVTLVVTSSRAEFVVDKAGMPITIKQGETAQVVASFGPTKVENVSGEIDFTVMGLAKPILVVKATGTGAPAAADGGTGGGCGVGGAAGRRGGAAGDGVPFALLLLVGVAGLGLVRGGARRRALAATAPARRDGRR